MPCITLRNHCTYSYFFIGTAKTKQNSEDKIDSGKNAYTEGASWILTGDAPVRIKIITSTHPITPLPIPTTIASMMVPTTFLVKVPVRMPYIGKQSIVTFLVTSIFHIEKKILRGRNRIFFLVPILQVHKKWSQLLAVALQHPKPVPAQLSRLKIS